MAQIDVTIPGFQVEVPETDLSPVLGSLVTLSQQVEMLSVQVATLLEEEPEPKPASYEPPTPYRAVRGQCSIATSRDRVERFLGALAAAGTTDYYYPTVLSYDGQAYWRTNLIPTADCVTDEYDPLETVVEIGYEMGMRVHSLVIAAFTPLSVPEWDLMHTRGLGEHWLDFTISEARRFLGDCCAEIANRYGIEGIALDYCRWKGTWATELGLSAEPIAATVAEIRERVHNVAPGMAIGMTPLADPRYAETDCGQPWASMLNSGLVEYVQPMCYSPKNQDYINYWIDLWQEWVDADKQERIYARPSCVWWDPAYEYKPVNQVVEELERFRERGYVRRGLWDDYRIEKQPDLIAALADGGW